MQPVASPQNIENEPEPDAQEQKDEKRDNALQIYFKVFLFYSRLGSLVFRDSANGFRAVKVMGVGAQFALALTAAC